MKLRPKVAMPAQRGGWLRYLYCCLWQETSAVIPSPEALVWVSKEWKPATDVIAVGACSYAAATQRRNAVAVRSWGVTSMALVDGESFRTDRSTLVVLSVEGERMNDGEARAVSTL
jgi:hypothetical protein